MRLYAFDGTWNRDEIDDEQETNVRRFHQAFRGADRSYIQGVGTQWGPVGRVLGGAFGIGGWARVHDAKKHLQDRWRGEPLVVVGFSRGSALALDFCNEIAGGIRSPHVAPPPGRRTAVPVVHFLGLWDLVASFGIPGNRINLGYQLTVPAIVERCYHAMALDERRYTFGLTRVKYATDRARSGGGTQAHEAWFRGAHSDVGGGNRNVARSNIALRWMMLHALACGVPLDAAQIPAAARPEDDLPVRTKQWTIRWPRTPAAGERVHHTVGWSLDAGFVDPPAPFQTEADPVVA